MGSISDCLERVAKDLPEADREALRAAYDRHIDDKWSAPEAGEAVVKDALAELAEERADIERQVAEQESAEGKATEAKTEAEAKADKDTAELGKTLGRAVVTDTPNDAASISIERLGKGKKRQVFDTNLSGLNREEARRLGEEINQALAKKPKTKEDAWALGDTIGPLLNPMPSKEMQGYQDYYWRLGMLFEYAGADMGGKLPNQAPMVGRVHLAVPSGDTMTLPELLEAVERSNVGGVEIATTKFSEWLQRSQEDAYGANARWYESRAGETRRRLKEAQSALDALSETARVLDKLGAKPADVAPLAKLVKQLKTRAEKFEKKAGAAAQKGKDKLYEGFGPIDLDAKPKKPTPTAVSMNKRDFDWFPVKWGVEGGRAWVWTNGHLLLTREPPYTKALRANAEAGVGLTRAKLWQSLSGVEPDAKITDPKLIPDATPVYEDLSTESHDILTPIGVHRYTVREGPRGKEKDVEHEMVIMARADGRIVGVNPAYFDLVRVTFAGEELHWYGEPDRGVAAQDGQGKTVAVLMPLRTEAFMQGMGRKDIEAAIERNSKAEAKEETEQPSTGKSAVVKIDPGATYVGFHVGRVDAEVQAKRERGEPIRREDILHPFLKAIGVPIYTGRISKRSGMGGYFKPKTGTIRIARANDLEVVAHEVAHWIDRQNPELREKWRRDPWRTELKGISYDQTKVYEGFAEYVRHWMTQPEVAASKAPRWTEYWSAWLEEKRNSKERKDRILYHALVDARAGMLEWYAQSEASKAESKIGGVRRRLDDVLAGRADEIRMSVWDDLHGIKLFEQAITGSTDVLAWGPYEAARLSRAAYSITEGAIRFGVPVADPDGSITYRGKGLEGILDPIARDLDDWILYAVGRSAKELLGQGREKLFTEAEIKSMMKLNDGRPTDEGGRTDFERAFDEYQTWNRGIVDFAVSKGLLSEEQVDSWRRSQYLPFYRVTQSGWSKRKTAKIEGGANPVKRLTGGTENLRDILTNMAENAAMLISESLKNEVRQKIVDIAAQADGVKLPGVRDVGKWVEKIPKATTKTMIDRDQLRRAMAESVGISRALLKVIDKGGAIPEHLTEQQFAALQAMVRRIDYWLDANEKNGYVGFWQFGQPPRTPGDAQVFAVRRNGKVEYYEVTEPQLWRSIANLNPKQRHPVITVLAKLRRFGQRTVTLTPDFLVRNIWRDTWHAWAFKRHAFIPVLDSWRGWYKVVTENQDYRDAIANGVGLSSYLMEEDVLRKHLQTFYSRKGIHYGRVIDSPRKLLYWMDKTSDAFEMGTRVMAYKRAIEGGETPRHAAYIAREISTDFALHGESQFVQFFTASAPFLNAGLQGLDRAYRGFTKDSNRHGIYARAGTMAVFSLALYTWNRGNPCYEGLEDWDKDMHWHFFLPAGLGGHGKADLAGMEPVARREACRQAYVHLRFPKPWELGAMSSIAERSLARTWNLWEKGIGELGAEMTGGAKEVTHIVSEQLRLNMMPYILEPLFELAINENQFTTRPIESMGMQRLLPYLRYNDYTGKTSVKALEQLAKLDPTDKYGLQLLSPAQLDHLIRGYFNTWGLYSLMLGDAIFDAKGPKMQWDRFPVIRAFYQTHPRERFPTEFWEMARAMEKTAQSIRDEEKKGRPEWAKRLKEQSKYNMEYWEDVRDVMDAYSEVTKEMHEMRIDPDLVPAEKTDELVKLRDQMNALMERSVKKVKGR